MKWDANDFGREETRREMKNERMKSGKRKNQIRKLGAKERDTS